MSAAGQPYHLGGDPGAAPAAPGSVYPIRRMHLNDVFGAGFRMLRHSPATMLGIPLAGALAGSLLNLLAMLLPGGGMMGRMMLDPLAMEDDPELMMDSFAAGEFLIFALLAALLSQALLVIAGGAIVLPTLRAAYGFRTGFGQALRLRARRFVPLLVYYVMVGVATFLVFLAVIAGFAFLFAAMGPEAAFVGVLLALLGVPVFLFLMLLLTVALLYAPMAIMVEDKGPIAAIGRSFSLHKGMWWPHIGTVLLLGLMLMGLMMIIAIPSAVLMGVGGGFAVNPEDPAGTFSGVMLVTMIVSTILDGIMMGLMVALWVGITTAMYLNARIRQEAADVALLSAAPHSPDDGRIIPASVEHLGHLQPAPGQPGPYHPNPYQQPGGDPQGQYQQSQYGQPPQGQPPYGQDPSGQNPYGQNPYGQSPQGQNPYGQPPQGQNPPGQNPPGQDPYGQNPYGQNPYGQNPYGQPPYGQPGGQDGQNGPNGQNGGTDDFGRPR